MNQNNKDHSIDIALAWCLAWGDKRTLPNSQQVLEEIRQTHVEGKEVSEEVRAIVQQVKQLKEIKKPETLTEIKEKYSQIWENETRIGLVYGGVTKVKQYVFEAAKLPEIRGASALLDRINLVDLPAFFGKLPVECYKNPNLNCENYQNYAEKEIKEWLNKNFPQLQNALIPELVIYSTGGNILAFCPAAFVDDLANAIEKRYTEETLTANSCAVGDTFRLLEIQLGLLRDNFEETPWLDWYKENKEKPIVKAYFDQPDITEEKDLFFSRKNFNELTGKLAALFQKRRSGNELKSSENELKNRSHRRYPPILETHPYLRRDESDRASTVIHAESLPNSPYFSEALARKRLVGQFAKRELKEGEELPKWYEDTELKWKPGKNVIRGWVTKFDEFLHENHLDKKYYGQHNPKEVKEAQTLIEIGDLCNRYVAYIYADGNNMGGYIQKEIKTPQDYQQFSQDVFEATEESVYTALAEHLTPRELKNLPSQKESRNRNGDVIHPFEIINIAGDDIILVVPADKALDIAYTIGTEFEKILVQKNCKYKICNEEYKSTLCHRYKPQMAEASKCILSTSIGLLITSHNTPIYYAQKFFEQLLKSAKEKAKELKKKYNYHGGTVDFLELKSVTLISSNLKAFREEGLTLKKSTLNQSHKLKLYSSPYTFHELKGIIETVKALQESEFPRSQLYQIRSLLEQGKNTAILNYRYFRVRLPIEKQKLLEEKFESAWCEAKTNNGNIAPWMTILPEQDNSAEDEDTIYETIWRDLIDLYPFFENLQSDEEFSTIGETQE